MILQGFSTSIAKGPYNFVVFGAGSRTQCPPPSKIDKTMVIMTNGSLIQVKSIAKILRACIIII